MMLNTIYKNNIWMLVSIWMFLGLWACSDSSSNATEMRPELAGLIISEINYHPSIADSDLSDPELREYIEITNTSDQAIVMQGVGLSSGIDFVFNAHDTLQAGQVVVLAADSAFFYAAYGKNPYGVYIGKLNNAGEKVTLKDTLANAVIFSFTYSDDLPWPVAADGAGMSLHYSSGDPNMSTNWEVKSPSPGVR